MHRISCSNCGKVDAPQRCSKCRSASYCGRSCQVSHWKSHKGQCKIIAKTLAEKEKANGKAHFEVPKIFESAEPLELEEGIKHEALGVESMTEQELMDYARRAGRLLFTIVNQEAEIEPGVASKSVGEIEDMVLSLAARAQMAAVMLCNLAGRQADAGDIPVAESLAEMAQELAAALGRQVNTTAQARIIEHTSRIQHPHTMGVYRLLETLQKVFRRCSLLRGEMRHQQHQFDQARLFLDQALTNARANEDRSTAAICLHMLGSIEREEGNLERSETLLKQGIQATLSQLSKPGQTNTLVQEQGTCFRELSKTYLMAGLFKDARKAAEYFLKLSKEIGSVAYGQAQLNLGTCIKYQAAAIMEDQPKAQKSADSTQDTPGNGALDVGEGSGKIAEEPENKPPPPPPQRAAGEGPEEETAEELLKKAEQAFREALQVAMQSESPQELRFSSLTSLASVLRMSGDNKGAVQHYNMAISVPQAVMGDPFQLAALRELAGMYEDCEGVKDPTLAREARSRFFEGRVAMRRHLKQEKMPSHSPEKEAAAMKLIDELDQESICPFCGEEVLLPQAKDESRSYLVLPCFHTAHLDCLKDNKDECPLCNKN
uniref:Uncharacterized protein n=1 Tax=Fibrocapsa japonica TaxID=94617 RepID=A0A7S2V4T4_9STRA|mmetsp:Transcript_2925/g.4304  ORF Transcript_2925/g.4304 Transcript_2925/m.4304 type:complete len:602 (+) Transcript_2925:118-1923(+)